MSSLYPKENESTRLRYFDLAKGVCILLVVCYHLDTATAGNVFLSPIRMPLYFFLSGFFFKTYDGFDAFCRKKVNNLLIPFLFFYLTTSVLLPIAAWQLCGLSSSTGHDWRLLYAFLTYADFPNLPLWFLWALFLLNLVFYGLHRLVRNVWLLGLCCLVLDTMLGYGFELPASLSKAFAGLIFFYMGYLFRLKNLMQTIDRPAVLLVALMFYLGAGFIPTDVAFWLLARFLLMSVAGVLSLILICRRIDHLPYVSYVGRYSIMVLVTHELLIRVLSVLHIDNPLWVFVCLAVLYLAIIPLMRRYLPYVTAQKSVFNR